MKYADELNEFYEDSMRDDKIYLIVQLNSGGISVRSSLQEATRDAEKLAQGSDDAYYVAAVEYRFLPLKNGDVAVKVY